MRLRKGILIGLSAAALLWIALVLFVGLGPRPLPHPRLIGWTQAALFWPVVAYTFACRGAFDLPERDRYGATELRLFAALGMCAVGLLIVQFGTTLLFPPVLLLVPGFVGLGYWSLILM